jgi:DNA repair exonuclease SbcCD ATPase subunit
VVTFEKIIIEGFGSIANSTTFQLDRGGIHFIRGKNGEGKTTLFSALAWVLYRINLKGTTNDKVTTWEQYQPEGFKGTRVALLLAKGEDKYMIVRHLNYSGTTKSYKGASKLMIFKSDTWNFTPEDMIGSEQHKEDQQVFINKLVGADSKIFLNSVLFGQRMKKLVESDNDEKRVLFEKLFELEFIQKAKERAKTEQTRLTFEIKADNQYLDNIDKFIEKLNSDIAKKQEYLTNFESNRDARLKEACDKLDNNTAKCLNIDTEKELLEKQLENFWVETVDIATYTKLTDSMNELKQKELDLKNSTELAEAKEGIGENSTKVHTAQLKVSEAKDNLKQCKLEIEKSKNKITELETELKDFNANCPYCANPLPEPKQEEVRIQIKSKVSKEKEVIKVLTKELETYQTAINLSELDLDAAKKALLFNENLNKTLQKSIDAQLIQVNQDKKTLQTDIENYKTHLAAYESKKEEKQAIKDKINTLSKDREVLEVRIEHLKEEIQALYDDSHSILAENELKELNSKLEDSMKEFLKLQEATAEKVKELERVEWWVKKGFGTEGIKSFVFSTMLEQLNSYVEKYAQRLGVSVRFSIDLTKATKPFTTTCLNIDGVETDFNELSGGEKQRVDVALAFAMHDLIGHTADTNLLIMDEFFEGLDAGGLASALDLVRVKADTGKTVYIISHHAVIDTLNTKTINVYKNEEGNTYIE